MPINSRKEWFDSIASRQYAEIRAALPRFRGTDDGDGETGLMLACRINDLEMIRLLAPEEAGVTNRDSKTALMMVALRDNPGACDILAPLEKGITLPDGRNALMLAAEAGCIESLTVLLNHFGFERDRNGYTSLDHAAASGKLDAVKLIATRSTALTVDDVSKALALATACNHERIVAFLSVIKNGLQSGVHYCLNCVAQLELLDELRSTNASLKIMIEKGDENVINQQNEIRKLNTVLKQLDTDVNTIKKRYDDLKKEHDQICREIQPLKDQLAFYERENMELKTESLVLTQELTQTKIQRDQFTSQTGRSAPELEEELSRLKIYLARAEEDISAYKATLDEVVDAKTRLESNEKELLNIIDSNEAERLAMEKKLHRLEVEKNELMEDLSISRNEVTQLTERVTLIQTESAQRIEQILSSPPELDEFGTTPLMTAAAAGDLQLAKSFLSQARMSNNDGMTALMFAAEANSVPVVDLLLELEGGMINNFGETALMIAAECNNMEVTGYLVEREGGMKRPDGSTALEIALLRGHFSVAEVLTGIEGLNVGDANTENRRMTELMTAAKENNIVRVWSLRPLQSGLVDQEGCTALMFAAQKGHAEIVRILLEKEAGISTNWGSTALMWAAQNNHIDAVLLLLEIEARFQKTDGGTALMYAAQEGHAEIVRVLMEKEAGMQNKIGWTALMYASSRDHISCAELLLEAEGGMCSNDKDTHGAGFSALMAAARNGAINCARLLLKREGGMRQNDNGTALMWAAKSDHANIVELLAPKEATMTTNHRHSMGQGVTALMMAAADGKYTSVQILLAQEAHMTTGTGKTALDYAKTSEIWSLIRNYEQ